MQEIKETEDSKAMRSEDFNKEADKGNPSLTDKMGQVGYSMGSGQPVVNRWQV
jgi:hypothetical protein